MVRTYNNRTYAEAYAKKMGMYIEEVDGKYIVFTKQPTVDTTADITVLYEEVESTEEVEAPKKDKKKKKLTS